MQNFFKFDNERTNNFTMYDGKMVLKSNDEKTQAIFNKVLSIFDKNKNGKLDADEIRTIWNNLVDADVDNNREITTDEVKKILKQNNVLSKLKMSPDDIIKFINIVNNTIKKSFAKTRTNTDTKLMNNLKQKYPENKYKYEKAYYDENFSRIEISDKKTGKFIAEFGSYKNGNYYINTNVKMTKYDKNGNIIKLKKFDKKSQSWNLDDPISDNLYKDITAKNKIGLPTTGKNFEQHIKQINNENIVTVLQNYKNNYGESLLDAINGEWGLDNDVKTRVIKYLNDCCANSLKWQDKKGNAKIDKSFYQGQIGDCWFLSSISAIQRSSKGQAILDNTIKDNKDGTYTVKFKGADKAYTVSALEILSADDFAEGDTDVRILELAAEKHYNILGIKNGGNPSSAFDLLLGTNKKWQTLAQMLGSKPEPQEIKKQLKNNNIIMTCTIDPFSKLWGFIVKDVPKDAKYKDDIATAHAYAVYDIDDKNIYLKNPWDTSKTVAIPLDVFDDYWGYVQYTEIE